MKSASINARLIAIDIHLFEFWLYLDRWSFWVYRSDDQSTLSGCSLMKTVTALDASRTLTVRTFPRPACLRELIASLNSKFAIPLRTHGPDCLRACRFNSHWDWLAFRFIHGGWHHLGIGKKTVIVIYMPLCEVLIMFTEKAITVWIWNAFTIVHARKYVTYLKGTREIWVFKGIFVFSIMLTSTKIYFCDSAQLT